MADNLIEKISPLFAYPESGDDSEIAKLLWLVRLRWLALSLFFVLAAPALIYGYLTSRSILFYLGLLGILLVFNLLTQLFWSEKGRKVSNTFICFQLAFDLLILSTLLFLTGGFSNPFIALFFLNASLGGLLISGRLSWPFVVLMHTLLLVLQLEYILGDTVVFNDQFPASILISHLLLFSFWLVMRSLGQYLESQNQKKINSKIWIEKKDRLRALGSLTAGFSHEFASPLQAAKLRLERAQRNNAHPDIAKALEDLDRCDMVLKQMNSAQMDTRDHHIKKILLHDLLNDIIDSWQEDNAEVKIQRTIEDVCLQKVPPLNFAQVVLNLLDNAAEASQEKQIEVHLENKNNHLVFLVQDQGSGFSNTILEHWGEPFVTTKAEGTGLGLYVSQLFAQSLGGELKIQNLSPTGAAVTLTWPTGDSQ